MSMFTMLEDVEKDVYGGEIYEAMKEFAEEIGGQTAGIVYWRDFMKKLVVDNRIHRVEDLPLIAKVWLKKQMSYKPNTVDSRLYKKLQKAGLNIKEGTVTCGNCSGTGKRQYWANGKVNTCWTCRGSGKISSWETVEEKELV